jgi:hypothetical protein
MGLLSAEAGGVRDGIRIRGTLRYPAPDYRGCRLVGRCPLATSRCEQPQELLAVAPGHWARCWRAADGAPAAAVATGVSEGEAWR